MSGLREAPRPFELLGDAPSVRWAFEIEVLEGDDRTFDFRGPFVHASR